MRKIVLGITGFMVAGLVTGAGACGQKPPLLAEKEVAAIAGEISGETAKRNLEGIARFHRQRGSKGFHEAAELVANKLKEYGLSDGEILQFPADGKIFYGTQRSRPAWDAESAKLSEISSDTEACKEAAKDFEKKEKAEPDKTHGFNCVSGLRERTIAAYETDPVVLAEDSGSANAMAELVDVGTGTKESDYAGKDVKGKIVLVSAQPGAVQDLAVGKFGAVGIVSYAQNQKTAWSGENLDAIRWGHLDTFSDNQTFGFMVSLRTAHTLQERLARGEKIQLHAVVKAGQHAGNYEVVTATIPGADARLKDEEIAFSCHLDHQRPGANDNASGCATILEVARTLQKLIDEGKLARPARTLRFIFPPEIEGTLALLTSKEAVTEQILRIGADGDPVRASARMPLVFTQGIKAVIHMDMVGGGPETKAVFHVTRGPLSKPSFVQDVAWAFAEWVNEESYQFAATGKAEYPMVSAEGGKEPLRAEYSAYTMGSDHDVYQDSSFGIPAIYLNDWPDRFIHTNLDSTANIDATKLKRAGFIGAASGYFLARRMHAGDVALWNTVAELSEAERNLEAHRRDLQLPTGEAEVLWNEYWRMSNARNSSLQSFGGPELYEAFRNRLSFIEGERPRATRNGLLIFRRSAEPKGPLMVFGYDYFAKHTKAGGVATPKLLSYVGLWGAGEEYAYEVLNFANGKRNAQEIRDAVSAEYGPVPLELVVEYLKALEEIGVVEK